MSALGVSLGLWQDRPPQEALQTATLADELGYADLWIGEMATYDAFALATAVAMRTSRIPLTLGPFAVTVRDPMMIALGAASVAALGQRGVSVALGTSSPRVVQEWHGRSRAGAVRALSESAQAVRGLLDGDKVQIDGDVVRTSGYRLRLPPPRSALTVAAFGPAAIRVAARYADRMVLNLLDVESAADLVGQLENECDGLGRSRPRVALWVCAAVSESPGAAIAQLRSGVLGYLAAPGYGEMFSRAGFADVVAYARTRPHPRELADRIPTELVEAVSIVGDIVSAEKRIAAYAAAGVDEIVIVPSSTDADPAGRATLTALTALSGRSASS